jgi:uncharacterized protein YecE (DUF72 family)
MEFREPRGYEPWVLDLLQEHNVALCVHDMVGSESPLLTIGPIVYLRLHGFGKTYGGSYPDEVLAEWAAWLRRAAASGRDAYVYFNNDVNGYAVRDATRLRAMVALQQKRTTTSCTSPLAAQLQADEWRSNR